MINNAVSNYFDQKKNPGIVCSNRYKPALGVTWQSVPAVRLFVDMPDKGLVSMDVRNVVIEKHIRMVTIFFIDVVYRDSLFELKSLEILRKI